MTCSTGLIVYNFNLYNMFTHYSVFNSRMHLGSHSCTTDGVTSVVSLSCRCEHTQAM